MSYRKNPDESLPENESALIIPRASFGIQAIWGVDTSTRAGQRLLRWYEAVEALVDALVSIRPLLIGAASFLLALLVSFLLSAH